MTDSLTTLAWLWLNREIEDKMTNKLPNTVERFHTTNIKPNMKLETSATSALTSKHGRTLNAYFTKVKLCEYSSLVALTFCWSTELKNQINVSWFGRMWFYWLRWSRPVGTSYHPLYLLSGISALLAPVSGPRCHLITVTLLGYTDYVSVCFCLGLFCVWTSLIGYVLFV